MKNKKTYLPPDIILINRVIIVSDDKILIIKRSAKDIYLPGYWEFPGGKLDSGQDVSQSLEREVEEETGLSIELIDQIAYYESMIIEHGRYSGKLYVGIFGTAATNKKEITLSGEHDDYAWITPTDFDSYEASPESKRAFATLHDKVKQISNGL